MAARRTTPLLVLRSLSLGALLTLFSTALAATPAAAAIGQITGLANKCLDVAGASPVDGTAVQLYE